MLFNQAKYSGLALVLISSFCSPVALADSQPTANSLFKWLKGHLVLELGGFYATQGLAQDIKVKEIVGNRYTVRSHSQGSVN